MTFLYPIGLLGLIGVPILIIVYLIKNRYTEQTVSSTYLWRLSERFIKRKNPFARFTGIISLILQLLLVTVLALAVAHPVITLPGAAREYCFILDSSASMNMEEGGEVRFEKAKDEIEAIIKKAKPGSQFSLIVVDDSTEVVFERLENKDKAISRLNSVTCSDSISDYSGALSMAQSYFNANPSLVTYLVTDASYNTHENINLINVSGGENNVSLESVKYYVHGDGNVSVSGAVASYGKAADVYVNVYADGGNTSLGEERLNIDADGRVQFNINVSLEKFTSLTVKVSANDAYAKDNVATVYSEASKNAYKALLVSDTPFFLESVMKSVSTADITVMTTDEYISTVTELSKKDKKISGYGLYIFDAINPIEMPEDGSVWLVGVNSNVEDSGFSIQGEMSFDGESEELTLNNAASSVVKKLTDGMINDSISIAKYIKCSLYSEFTTIYSYLGNPVVFTGRNAYGNREVVISFNLHDSNFVLSLDYIVLTGNLLEYSFPEIIDETEYFCGDTAQINVISGCESIRVTTPSGEIIYTDVSEATSKLMLSEVGEYKLTVNISGSDRELSIYSSVPMEERPATSEFKSISIRGEASDVGMDGKLDMMLTLFILAALLFTAEWVVYCYDKYQLR